VAAAIARVALLAYAAAMPDFERRITVALDADEAFDRLADPAQLPRWLVGVTLDEALAVDGDPALQDEGEAKATAPEARFLADRKARRIEWSAPSGDYSGELEFRPMLAGMSAIVVSLHTRDAVDPATAEQALEDGTKNLQRALSA
jgi:hypothetical protein